MNQEQRTTLENLVFSYPDRNQSLDARLQPFLDLIADVERTERERCAAKARRAVLRLEQARKWAAAKEALAILNAIEGGD